MPKIVSDLYVSLFGKAWAYRLNRQLHLLGLRGMGVLNYESPKASGEADFIARHVAPLPGGIVLDVGANVGDYSAAVRAANSRLDIVAFEPHPSNFAKLVRNTGSLGVKAVNCAVGSQAGKTKLYDYAARDGSAHASVYRKVLEELHRAEATSHDVDMIALDDFCDREGIREVKLLKIDTEGHEMAVLRGALGLITAGKVDMIHFEFNEMNIESRVYFKDFRDLLGGYDLYRMLPAGLLRLPRYEPIVCEIFAYQNIVALRR